MHKKSIRAHTIRAAALAAVLGVTLSTAALAQFGPPHPPGPPPPFGGPPGGPHSGGPGRGPRPSTAANAPLPALTAGLELSAAQQTKVAQIQEQFNRQRRKLMSPPPGGGPPPDPGAMRGAWDKMRALSQTADAGIAAVLSGPQKAALPALLRTLDDLRIEGIPPATYGVLKLSESQTARLTDLARTSQQATRQALDTARRSGDFGSVRASMQSERRRLAARAAALLTPAQRSIVSSYKAAHPRPPFGGPGGPGGPDGPGGPGGFGPPPPPEERGAQDEDHGRPVALVARDLGVTPAQFRAAFRKVHPAGAGQEPTQAQRQANRRVLSERLGVSPERLDAVMDKYRPGGRGTNGPPPPDAPPLN